MCTSAVGLTTSARNHSWPGSILISANAIMIGRLSTPAKPLIWSAGYMEGTRLPSTMRSTIDFGAAAGQSSDSRRHWRRRVLGDAGLQRGERVVADRAADLGAVV